MSKKRLIRAEFMLLAASLVWGFGFVSQSVGMSMIRPFTFNIFKHGIGAIALLPMLLLFRGRNAGTDRRKTIRGGIVCGCALFLGASFQQYGIAETTAGKSSFITSLYIICVPAISVAFGKRIRRQVWIAAVLALAGLYLLCVKDGFSIGRGDLLILACAPCFALHILTIAHYSEDTDGVAMSAIQFLVTAVLSVPCALLFDRPVLRDVWDCRVPLLYSGVMACGAGYTLQVLGQKDTEPATASLLMSLEAVFGALGGWLILGERLSARELFGAAMVFGAVLLAQMPERHAAKVSPETENTGQARL